jgi:hypothetical protein
MRRRLGWVLCATACAAGPHPDTDPEPELAVSVAAAYAVVDTPWTPPAATLPDGADRTSLEARWDFGDGITAQGWQPVVTFDAPGHRTAFLTVTDARGRQATDAFALSVHWPVPDERVDHAGGRMVPGRDGMYAAMTDHDLIAFVPEDGSEVRWIDPGCAAPSQLATVAPSANGDLLAVGCLGRATQPSAVAVLEAEADGVASTVRRRIEIRDGVLRALVLVQADADHETVLVTTHGPSDPGRTDGDAGSRLLRYVDGERTYALSAWWGGHKLGALAYGGSLYAVDAWAAVDETVSVWEVREDNPWEPEPRAIALPDDTGPDSDTSSRGRPTFLDASALSPDGRTLAIGGLRANIARGRARDGLDLTDETTVRGTLRRIDRVTGTQTASARVDNRDRYAALAWSPQGDWLYAAVAGSGEVDVVDPWRWERVGAAYDGGAGLTALWVSGASLWGYAALDRAVVRWSLEDPSAPVGPTVIDLQPPQGEPLPPDVLWGAKLFAAAGDPRMSLDGYIACASCHRDGEPDGHTWDFTQRGEGLRNTPDLRGFGARSGPIHWSGNFDEIQDFEADIRLHQGGLGYLDDASWQGPAGPSLGAPKAGLSDALDALDAYVRWLPARPPVVSPSESTNALVTVGEQAFVRLGCDVCHPAGGTDSRWLDDGRPLLHDVATITPSSGNRLGGPLWGLDTPSLIGTWATGPWLHDGSAATLAEAIQRHAEVEDADVAGLLAYLASL